MSKKHIILAGVTTLLVLATLILLSYHTETRCNLKFGDYSSRDCTDDYKSRCVAAFAISGHGVEDGTPYTMQIACAWGTPTAILGLIGLSLALLFLGIFAMVIQGKNLKRPLLGLAGLMLPILVVSLGLMAKDVKGSFNYNNQQRTWSEFKPLTYIINALLLLVGIIFLCQVTVFGVRFGKSNAKSTTILYRKTTPVTPVTPMTGTGSSLQVFDVQADKQA